METARYWHFEQDRQTGYWTWQHELRNGRVEHMSTPYPEFTEAFLDAMRFGFNPAVDAYTAGDGQHVTHHPPQRSREHRMRDQR
jgi:hypothetical protein